MSDESYLTSSNPTVKQWLEYNEPLFQYLRSDRSSPAPSSGYAYLTDFDRHARVAGRDMDEWFKEITHQVGDLGAHKLTLIYTDMDEAWHITLRPHP